MVDVAVTTSASVVDVSASDSVEVATAQNVVEVVGDSFAVVPELTTQVVDVTSVDVTVTAQTTTSIVEMQPTGAPGQSAEDLVPYSERIDFVGSTTIYKGWAALVDGGPGPDESDAVWRIQKITLNGDDTTKIWAEGSAAFNQVWDDRLTLTYS